MFQFNMGLILHQFNVFSLDITCNEDKQQFGPLYLVHNLPMSMSLTRRKLNISGLLQIIELTQYDNSFVKLIDQTKSLELACKVLRQLILIHFYLLLIEVGVIKK